MLTMTAPNLWRPTAIWRQTEGAGWYLSIDLMKRIFTQLSIKRLYWLLLGPSKTYKWQAGVSEALETVHSRVWKPDWWVLDGWATQRVVPFLQTLKVCICENHSCCFHILFGSVLRFGQDIWAHQHSHSLWAEVWSGHGTRQGLRRLRQLQDCAGQTEVQTHHWQIQRHSRWASCRKICSKRHKRHQKTTGRTLIFSHTWKELQRTGEGNEKGWGGDSEGSNSWHHPPHPARCRNRRLSETMGRNMSSVSYWQLLYTEVWIWNKMQSSSGLWSQTSTQQVRRCVYTSWRVLQKDRS